MILIGNTAKEVRAWLAQTFANEKTGHAECALESVPEWAGVSLKKSPGPARNGQDRNGGH
jgi:hypothetical protein